MEVRFRARRQGHRDPRDYPGPEDPAYRPIGIDHVFDMTNMPSYRLTIDMRDLDGARIGIAAAAVSTLTLTP